MAKEREVKMVFKVDDQGSMKLDTIKSNIGNVTKEVSSMDKSLQLIKWDSIINLAERAGSALKRAFDFAEMGARAKAIEDSFKSMAMNIGVSGDLLIKKMKETTNATIDDTILMQKAMRGLSEGFSPDQLIRLGEAARVAARYMGTDVKSAFESVIDSLINLRERGLKTAGFVIDTDEVFKKYAKTLEVDVDELNDYGKTMALTGAIIDQTKIKIEALGGLQETEFERIQKAKTAWEELSESIAKVASKIADKLLPNLTSLMKFTADNPHIMAFLTGRGLEEIISPKVPIPATIPSGMGIESGIPAGGGKSQIKVGIGLWDKDWIKEWAEEWNKNITAMEDLGIKAQIVHQGIAKSAIENLEIVKEAWKEGKATGLDYYNSMKAASDILKKGMGDQGDQTQKLFDLSEDLEKQIKGISWEDPDRKKKVQTLIDTWIEARGKILELTKTPVQIIADIKPAEREFEKLQKEYEKYKTGIESNPIKIKIENYLPEILQGMGSAEGKISGVSPIKFASDVEANVNFTATGMSPKIPLGDAFTKIISSFKTMQEKTSAMEATIEFAGISDQLKGLQKQYDMYQGIIQQRVYQIQTYSTSSADPMQNWLIKEAKGFQEDILSQMQTYNLQLAKLKFGLGLPGAEKEFYSLFQSQYGSFQHGTDYVPRTGLALVHQGEKIIPANQNFAMGGNTFYITGNNPKEIAEEVANILTYKRSGNLAKAIKQVANS